MLKRVIFIAGILMLGVNTAEAADTLWSVLWRPDYRANIFRSNDDGVNWYSISSDPSWPIGELTACALTRDLNYVFYLALWDENIPLKLYKSTNYGVDWNYIADISSTTGGQDVSISMICAPDEKLYTATWSTNHPNKYPRCFKSTNQGTTWTDLGTVCNLPRTSDEAPISITSDTLGNLYIFLAPDGAGSNYSQFYKSGDGGNTWDCMNPQVFDIPSPNDPATGVTVGTDNTLWITFYYDPAVPWILYSLDEGVNWTQTAELSSYPDGSDMNNYIDMILGNSGALYVAVWGDSKDGTDRLPFVYRSTDGNTWTYQGEIAHWLALEHPSLSLLNVSMGSMGVQESASGGEKEKGYSLGLKSYPNPFTQKTVISYQLSVISKNSRLTPHALQIYDLSGRLIRNLPITDYRSPITEVTWDGKNRSGRKVPPGIYFCILESGGEKAVYKISFINK